MNENNRPGRLRLLALAVLVVTFVAGALMGVAYERVLRAGEPGGPPPMEGRRPPPSRLFEPGGPMASLNLTDEQRARIEAVLEEEGRKSDALLREVRPRMKARYDSTTAAIRGVLTPAQQAEFDRIHREHEERMHRRHGRDGRHDGPPPHDVPPPDMMPDSGRP